MPHADATYVASAERRHRLDRPKSAVEDDCSLGRGEPRHKNKTKQVTDIREDRNVSIRYVDTPPYIAQSRRCARRQPGRRRAVHRLRARRGVGQDRHGQPADRRAVGAGAKRGRRRQICRGRDQQEGRHFGPPSRAPGRRFGQRRRHRRAEDAQIDRSRPGLRHPRRCEFRHRLCHVAGDIREESVPHRARRSHRPDHRHQLQMERVPGLQHHDHGRVRGDAGAGEEIRQEVVLHHAGLRLRPLLAGRLRQGADQARRHL